MTETGTLVIGGGPAGLTAGYALAKAGHAVTVWEADARYLGGLSRTEEREGFRFDIGGHRFYSKSSEIEQLWDEILPNGFLTRPRKSRIFYAGKFYDYPLRATNVLRNLPPAEIARCAASYAYVRARPDHAPRSVEDWVTNQFGRRLYEIFFKTYTEKVWGIPCSEISADWAAQRIKGLSLTSAVKNAVVPRALRGWFAPDDGEVVKSLIETFRYPALGPGQMWDAAAARIRELGGTVTLDRRVRALAYDSSAKTWRVEAVDHAGKTHAITSAHVVSSAPMRELIASLSPRVDDETRRAADALKYRDFLTVALAVRARDVFDDNWIYIHDPGVKVGRIQNFRAWSPHMVPDETLSVYGLEYFCFENDGLWDATDDELVSLATREMERIGLLRPGTVRNGWVVRQKKAYPIYDHAYEANVDVVRRALERDFPSLHLAGRNGMHKYNNQDHAMMTGLLSAKNILAGKRDFDIWRVNEDAEYGETTTRGSSGERMVPRRI